MPGIAELLGSVFGIFKGWVDHKLEMQRIETQSAVDIRKAEVSAQITRLQSAQDAEQNWDQAAVQQMEHSWKDEWFTILLSIPMILCFLGNWGMEVVFNGFHALDVMPDWYKYALGTAIAASFGYRGLIKFMNTRSNGQ